MKKFCLITNNSGCTYWSYEVSDVNQVWDPIYVRAVKKHKKIYINRNGGWFHEAAVKHIVSTVVQDEFPMDE